MSKPQLHSDVCACVLAGGRSRRMGTNKALLDIGGQTLIEHVLAQVRAVTDEIWISANEIEPYDFLNHPVILDLYPGQGPLAGLHATFTHSSRPLVLLVACDLPAIRAATLDRLLDFTTGFDIVLPMIAETGVHALCGVFHQRCFEPLEQNLRTNINKVTALLDTPELKTRWLTPKEGGFHAEEFININSINDLEIFRGGQHQA